MSSTTPSSLPGFLRRTIRSVNYEDHEDDDDDDDDVEAEAEAENTKRKVMNHSFMNPVSVPVGSPHKTSLIPTAVHSSSLEEGEQCDSPAPTSKVAEDEQDNDINQNRVTKDMTNLNLEDSENPVDCKFRLVATNNLKFKSKKVGVDDVNVNDEIVLDPQKQDTMNATSSAVPSSSSDTLNRTSLVLESDLKSKSPLNNAVSSTTSATTSTTTTSTTTTKSTQVKNYKEEQFEKVITSSVVDIDHLKRLAWNGIPPQHRPLAWKILLGYLPTNSSRRFQTLKRKRAEYRDAILQHYDIEDHSRTMQEQETLRQVLVDVPRTAPDIPLFRNDSIRQLLARLLYIWAMRHPASSYVQGINDLATPLVAVFLSEYLMNGNDVLQGQELEDLSPDVLQNVEADVYWCLTNLLAGIQDHYTQDQPGVQRMVMKLEELIKRIDVNLTRHLEETGVQFIQFAFRWMNCLLLREFHLRSVIRLWDTYLSEGHGGFETFHVYVCAAFLCQFSAELQNMQFDELFAFMQNIPTGNWDDGKIEIVLSQAFVLSTLFQGSDAHLTSSNPR